MLLGNSIANSLVSPLTIVGCPAVVYQHILSLLTQWILMKLTTYSLHVSDTYNVFGGTLSLTQSVNQPLLERFSRSEIKGQGHIEVRCTFLTEG